MAEHRADQIDRRKFLMTCGALAVGGCFSGINVRDALAASQQVGKPLFTDAQFNARLASFQRGPGFRTEIEDLKRDLLGYLDTRFSLTPQQREVVSRLPQTQRLQLNANLDRALQQNLGVKLQIKQEKAGCPRDLRVAFAFTNQDLIITAMA